MDWITWFGSFLFISLGFFFRRCHKFYFFCLYVAFFQIGICILLTFTHQVEIPKSTLEMTGIVINQPIKKKYFHQEKLYFIFQSEKIKSSTSTWDDIKIKFYANITYAPNTQIEYGDRIRIYGKCWQPESQLDRMMMDAYDATLRVERDSVQILSKGHVNFFKYNIYALRQFLISKIESSISHSSRSIIQAIILGDKSNITPAIRDSFSKSGTSHLLALSGLHIALIVAILYFLLIKMVRLPNDVVQLCIFVILPLYCVLTGAAVSTLRATTMCEIILFGKLINRRIEWINLLLFSAFIMLLNNPIYIFKLGFQLSFLTLLVLIFCSYDLNDWRKNIVSPFILYVYHNISNHCIVRVVLNFFIYLINSFVFSFFACLATILLIADYFHLVVPIAPIANLVMIPFMTLIVGGGMFFCIAQFIHPMIQSISGYYLSICTETLIKMSVFFSSFKFSYIRFPSPDWIDYIIFYGCLGLFFCRKTFKISLMRYSIILLLFFNFYCWKDILPPQFLKVCFIDVGHGDASLIQLPKGGTILVDTGKGDINSNTSFDVAPFLWDEGIRVIDVIIITHPDWDHYGGLSYLLKEFDVKHIFVNGDKGSRTYHKILNQTHVPITILNARTQMTLDASIVIEVLHPYDSWIADESIHKNDNSIVFLLKYQNKQILFTGDADEMAVEHLVHVYGDQLASDILKVPHHGSHLGKYSENFFKLVQGKYAVISTSKYNRFNLPNEDMLHLLFQNGYQILQTSECKSISFVLDTDGIRLIK